VGQLNCNGLNNKLDDFEFISKVKSYDICILIETHRQHNFIVDGYKSFFLPATKLHGVKSGRYSGGISILIKLKLQNVIKLYKTIENYAIWLKIDQKLMNLDKHIFIGGIYIPPIDSKYAIARPFDNLEHDLSELSNGYIVCGGDFNARTSNLDDYLLNYDGDNFMDLDCVSGDITPLKRINMDDTVNTYGRAFLKFCKSSNLTILNGRSPGDFNGRFTCYRPSGSSVVDYGLISPCLMTHLEYFNVCPPSWYSDHSLLQFKFSIPLKYDNLNDIPKMKLTQHKNQFIWDSSSKEKVELMFNSSDISANIHEMEKSDDIPCINVLCDNVCNIYRKVMKLSLKPKKNHNYSLKKNVSPTCQTIRYNICKLGKLLQLFPSDPFLRGKFYVLKKQLKCFSKQQYQDQKERIMSNLNLLESKDPNAFWNLVKNIRKSNINGTFDPEVFYNHFKNLSEGLKNDYFDADFKSEVENKLKVLKGASYIELLDKEIDFEELKQVVILLKNNKSVGFDGISNELIKCSLPFMYKLILLLFNNILKNNTYVDCWLDDFITPILKSGGLQDDPNNYRGISISSCLGKVFTIILKNRLAKFLESNKLLSNCQIGFSSGKRTTDHIFVLKTLLDISKSKKKPLFMCFIDLKSAFDTVWRDGLLLKLLNMGLSTNFINLLKDIFKKTSACVKTKDGYTKKFATKVGTRQGCNLSPLLFNCFINDIPALLDSIEAQQPLLLGEKLSCLMYADDLILFSYSAKGLQSLIDKVVYFCNKWRLTINITKTKIMVAFKTKVNDTWEIYGKKLEIVNSFCYLGIVVDRTGGFSKAIDRLYVKANRAYFAIKSKINFYTGANVNTLCKLFDSMVKPILLYGSELWGVFNWRVGTEKCIKECLLSHSMPYEKLHLRFCKQTLGMSKNSSNFMTMSELGRFGLSYNIVQSVYKYWQHLLNSDQDSLCYKAVCENILLDKCGISSYYGRIKDLFKTLNVENFIEPACNINNVKTNAKMLSNNFSKMYTSNFHKRLLSNEKYTFYNSIKRCYVKEKYLSFTNNSELRKSLSKIRCGDNYLPINYFRYKSSNINSNKCFLCKSKRGDEKHALLECSSLADLRDDFFLKLNVNFPHLQSLSKEQNIRYLLQCVEVNPTIKFAIYCGKILKLYKDLAKELEFNHCSFKEKSNISITTRVGRTVSQPNKDDYVFY